MSPRTRRVPRSLALAAATSLLVTAGLFVGCGGDDEGEQSGLDRSDPEAVANAFAMSLSACGERGAGVRAELAYPESAASEHRAELADEEKPGGCEPETPKPFTTALVPSREAGIPAVVEISNEDCEPTEVPMIEVDGAWFVDETEVDPGLLCS